ncbi:MAG: hypothetical protein NVS9B5_35280 [Terriglobales bacterium]
MVAMVAVLAGACPYLLAESDSKTAINIEIVDQTGWPVPAAEIALYRGEDRISRQTSNEQGSAKFTESFGLYRVHASREGYQDVTSVFDTSGHSEPYVVLLRMDVKLPVVEQEINVQDSVDSTVLQSSVRAAELDRSRIKEIPGRPATISDALATLPGVVRSENNKIFISGSAEHHSAYIVNSADATDPATGEFGAGVPIDAIENMSVLRAPFMAQYGSSSSGVVAVNTKRGGEKWNFEVNDPFPEFRIRSAHIVGLREITPRMNFTGPLVRNRFYFSEALEYDNEKHAVLTLHFPFNETKQQSFNSFTQVDYFVSTNHTVTATLQMTPSDQQYVNLDYFNPQSTTPDFSNRNYTGTILDRLGVKGGLLQSTLTLRHLDGNVRPQGLADMVLTPVGNSGNYFSQQKRSTNTTELIESYAASPRRLWGTHSMQGGFSIAASQYNASMANRPVDIMNATGVLLKKIQFTDARPFGESEVETGAFAQDHYILNNSLALDVGMRFERQARIGDIHAAPRFGFAITPLKSKSTILRGGIGVFFDHVPLDVFAFDRYPLPICNIYGAGLLLQSRIPYSVVSRHYVSRRLIGAASSMGTDFSPYSTAWSLEAEQQISSIISLRANYMQNLSSHVILLSEEQIAGQQSLSLSDSGHGTYKQFELGTKFKLRRASLQASYIRSHALGDLNEFDNFLGSFQVPVIGSNREGVLPGDIPDRILLTGGFNLPWKLRFTPLIEYRSGFPFYVRDAMQNYVVDPRYFQTRLPGYFSLATRMAKDFKVTEKYTLTVALSGSNVTEHFNALAVHANISDPQFGMAFGTPPRRARIDMDVTF